MRIYNNGELDLDAAALELDNSSKLTNANQKAEAVARLSAAALLDIAGSLRVLAVESALAVQYAEAPDYDVPMMTDNAPGPTLPDIVDALPGMRVQLKAPDAKGRNRTGTLTGVDGIDQGEPWAGVEWDDKPGADAAKVYAAHLEHYTGELEGDQHVEALLDAIADPDAGEPELERGGPDVPPISDAPEADPDDFDDDFEAPDALALLEARQAKAAKKGKKK